MRCFREGEHRRQATRRVRACYRDVCRLRPRIAKRLVRRRPARDGIAVLRKHSGLPVQRPESSPVSAIPISFRQFRSFYTRDRGAQAEAAGKQGKELPAVTGNRQALLNLPLEAYKQYETQVEQGFVQAAKFLHMLHIYRIFDLPYQSQIVPLAAILADIGDAWEHEANRAKLVRWYWNGVLVSFMVRRSRRASRAISWKCRPG